MRFTSALPFDTDPTVPVTVKHPAPAHAGDWVTADLASPESNVPVTLNCTSPIPEDEPGLYPPSSFTPNGLASRPVVSCTLPIWFWGVSTKVARKSYTLP